VSEKHEPRAEASDEIEVAWLYLEHNPGVKWPTTAAYSRVPEGDVPWLVRMIRTFLPVLGTQDSRSVRLIDYLHVQFFAYGIEDQINPNQFGRGDHVDQRFEELLRWMAFCGSGSLEDKEPPAVFLRAFDDVLLHYGWDDPAARDKFDATGFHRDDYVFGSTVPYEVTSLPMTAPPPPISEAALTALERASSSLWKATSSLLESEPTEPSKQLGVAEGRQIAKQTLSVSTEDLALALLAKHPGWTLAEFAKALGLNPGHLRTRKRMPRFHQARAVAIREDKLTAQEAAARDESTFDEDANQRVMDASVEDDHLKALFEEQ